ncbi:hypothetical protein NE236_28050 [Actinoallomurus purpureus]|uniref:hypothetical protein n=1 Tax=Actinoallomurus purpureus TaxID=478114 RepID=UPI0020922583|nr:hypothetical protein [Actinoallomurus purpureus]MCO6008834.1 hypothetical protein [Actinoallomurus purpureus]
MSGHGLAEAVGAFGMFTLATSVITVSIRQLAGTRRAKVLVVREQEYRKIAEEAVATQQSTEQLLTELNGRLTEMQSRMESLERILQTVE